MNVLAYAETLAGTEADIRRQLDLARSNRADPRRHDAYVQAAKVTLINWLLNVETYASDEERLWRLVSDEATAAHLPVTILEKAQAR